MDVVLITLGVLGLGAIVISAYVFVVAARNYVSDDPERARRTSGRLPAHYISRDPKDRRSGQPVTFPLMVNGILIEKDRRSGQDRRRSAA